MIQTVPSLGGLAARKIIAEEKINIKDLFLNKKIKTINPGCKKIILKELAQTFHQKTAALLANNDYESFKRFILSHSDILGKNPAFQKALFDELSKISTLAKWKRRIPDLFNLFKTDLELLHLVYQGKIIPEKQSVNLAGKYIENLDGIYACFSNLTEISLHCNNIEELPSEFGNLSNLEDLSLWSNQLKELPESFGNLIKLENLDLSYNLLEKLPKTFGNLSNLEDLNLWNNPLEELPETFGNLTKLVWLNIYNSTLKTLPKTFNNLNNIKYLRISSILFDSLPDKIKNSAAPFTLIVTQL